jgi:hypothetical protein
MAAGNDAILLVDDAGAPAIGYRLLEKQRLHGGRGNGGIQAHDHFAILYYGHGNGDDGLASQRTREDSGNPGQAAVARALQQRRVAQPRQRAAVGTQAGEQDTSLQIDEQYAVNMQFFNHGTDACMESAQVALVQQARIRPALAGPVGCCALRGRRPLMWRAWLSVLSISRASSCGRN